MVVKKEILSRQIEEVNNSHSEKHQALVEQSDGMLLEMNVTCYNSTLGHCYMKTNQLIVVIHFIDLTNKMREYAIIKNPVVDNSKSDEASKNKNSANVNMKEAKKKARSAELKEIERELECPVCMEVSRPPIYQCEEGHIICSSCKPLLKVCPHNCGQKYSEPAIRCRFAEKLADRYFKALEEENK